MLFSLNGKFKTVGGYLYQFGERNFTVYDIFIVVFIDIRYGTTNENTTKNVRKIVAGVHQNHIPVFDIGNIKMRAILWTFSRNDSVIPFGDAAFLLLVIQPGQL